MKLHDIINTNLEILRFHILPVLLEDYQCMSRYAARDNVTRNR